MKSRKKLKNEVKELDRQLESKEWGYKHYKDIVDRLNAEAELKAKYKIGRIIGKFAISAITSEAGSAVYNLISELDPSLRI